MVSYNRLAAAATQKLVCPVKTIRVHEFIIHIHKEDEQQA